ncbi:MAG: hypothetical protein KAR38_05750, partial [Calditrichia bacterium]|nr:hypothetical protein [Calditrichia bacterium]
WVDELRASDVRKEPGMAMRVQTKIDLADVASYSGLVESKDANFHGLGQTSSASSVTSENLSHNLSLSPHKFFPTKFNLAIPISIRYSISKRIPKYYTRSDRLTDYGYSSLMDRFSALIGKKTISGAELQKEVKFSESFGYSISFKRTKGPKDPWYLKYTLNQMSTKFNYSNAVRHDYNTKHAETESKSFNLSYSIPFGKKNYVEPFKWTGKIPVLNKLSAQKVYYTPSQITTSLSVKGDYSERESRVEGSESTTSNKILTNRKIQTQYSLTEEIKMNFSRNYSGDASLKYDDFNKFMNSMASSAYFGTTTRMGQSFGANYNPKRWFTFFTPTITYSSQFSYAYKISNNAINFGQ